MAFSQNWPWPSHCESKTLPHCPGQHRSASPNLGEPELCTCQRPRNHRTCQTQVSKPMERDTTLVKQLSMWGLPLRAFLWHQDFLKTYSLDGEGYEFRRIWILQPMRMSQGWHGVHVINTHQRNFNSKYPNKPAGSFKPLLLSLDHEKPRLCFSLEGTKSKVRFHFEIMLWNHQIHFAMKSRAPRSKTVDQIHQFMGKWPRKTVEILLSQNWWLISTVEILSGDPDNMPIECQQTSTKELDVHINIHISKWCSR